MSKSWEKGEILRNARRLVQTKGDSALGYAEKMAKRMRETGEEDDRPSGKGSPARSIY